MLSKVEFAKFMNDTQFAARASALSSAISNWNNSSEYVKHLDDVSIGDELHRQLKSVTSFYKQLISYGRTSLMLTDKYRLEDDLSEVLPANIEIVLGQYLKG